MLQYATWKYVLAAVIILLSVLYAAPNLYPQYPAVQVVANRGGAVDDNLLLRVRETLDKAGLVPKSVAIEAGDLIVRAAALDQRTQLADLLRPELGTDYNVALNLASTVPEWLGWFGARQMAMGLDLRGGVQFLLEIDQQAAIDKRANAFADEITTVLREAEIPYTSVSRTSEGIQVLLKDGADMDRFRTALTREAPELTL